MHGCWLRYNALRQLSSFHPIPSKAFMAPTFHLLAVFAHPDDEVSIGGTLARAVSEGAAVTLVCATRGEAATIYSPPDYGATTENLAQVRTAELECCCRALGITDLRWLDWPDGGVAQLDRHQAVTEMVALLRSVQPDVVITHAADGGYPHPDHIAIYEIVLAAWEAAADPAYHPDLGTAWAVSRLYVRAIPRSFFEENPAFAQFRIQLNGEEMAFFATPDEEISTVVDVTPWVDQRMAAWECHLSQHNPAGLWRDVPKETQRAAQSREYLRLIAQRMPAAEAEAGWLWSSAPLAEADSWAGPEENELPPDAAAAADRFSAALRSRRTYLLLYQDYRKHSPKPEFAALLRELIAHTQDAIALLSSALRRLDRMATRVSINEKLLAQGNGRKGAAGKLNFILNGMTKNLEWIRQQRALETAPTLQAVWDELIAADEQDQQQAKALLTEIENATGQSLSDVKTT